MPLPAEIMDRLAQILARSAVKTPLYHGTGTAFEQFNPVNWGYTGFQRFGPGIYLTDNPKVANWATNWHPEGRAPNIRKVFLDTQHPFDLMSKIRESDFRPAQQNAQRMILKVRDADVKSLPYEMQSRYYHRTNMGEDPTWADLLMGADTNTKRAVVSQALQQHTGADAFYSHDPRDLLGEHTEYVAFDPTKILNPWTLTPASILAALAAGRQSRGPGSAIDRSDEPA